MRCPDDNALTGFVDGVLAPAEAERIEVHIDGCASCRSLLVDLARTLEPAPAPPDQDEPAVAAAYMDGRYVPRRVLGVGGMSVVYLGFDTALQRRVALKVMSHAPEDVRARLRREAQALGMLSHPNVVDVYDVELSEAGAFLACEYVEGGSLRHWLAEGPRPWRQVLAVIDDACQGLEAAHSVGLVHRDVTPNNILVGADGRGRVADFGLARLPETQPPDSVSQRSPSPPSRTGAAGTPGYMAPEVSAGAAADPRADQYGLCASAYEALLGPGPGTTTTTNNNNNPTSPDVPRAIERVLRRGLAADPARRFPSVAALRAALARAATKRHGATRVAIVAVACATLGIAAWTSTPRTRDPCVEADAAVQAEGLDGVQLPPAVSARLERYVQRWESSRDAACDATHTDADARDHDRRWMCVQARKRALSRLVAELGARGASDIAATLQRAEGLPPPEDCNDADFVHHGFAVPPPDKAADVLALQDALHGLRVQRDLDGDNDAALGIEALAAQAQTLGHDPLTAEVLQVQGLLARDAGDTDRARELLTASAHLAAGAHADETASWSWVILMSLEGLHAMDDAAAEAVLPHLDASLQRLGNPDRLRAARQESLATIRDRQRRFEDAERLYDETLLLTERALGQSSLKYARARGNVGVHHAQRGNAAEARTHLLEALELTRAVLGPGSPTEATCLTNLANLASLAGQFDEAIAQAERALLIFGRDLPEADPRVIRLMMIVGLAHSAAGRHEPAVAALSRVAELVAERDPPQSPARLNAVLQLSGTLARAGRFQAAQVALTPTLALVDEPGIPPAVRTRIILEHGLNLLDLGQPSAALARCAQALAALDPGVQQHTDAQACIDEARAALTRP